jgi:hypothetical protein
MQAGTRHNSELTAPVSAARCIDNCLHAVSTLRPQCDNSSSSSIRLLLTWNMMLSAPRSLKGAISDR